MYRHICKPCRDLEKATRPSREESTRRDEVGDGDGFFLQCLWKGTHCTVSMLHTHPCTVSWAVHTRLIAPHSNVCHLKWPNRVICHVTWPWGESAKMYPWHKPPRICNPFAEISWDGLENAKINLPKCGRSGCFWNVTPLTHRSER